jgi:hypothetical protein
MTYWSWILAIVGVSGMFLVGQKVLKGWIVLFCNECLWIAYAISTKQYGFVVMATAYIIVYIKSYSEWRKR